MGKVEEPTERLESGRVVPQTTSSSGSPASNIADADLPKGTMLGRYVVLEPLGSGGMGVVYAAYDPELNRRVALKLMHPRTIAAGGGKVRMLREAQALARLSHPNVVAIYDVGTLGERVFLAMELVDGMTLSATLKERMYGWRELIDIFTAAGRGLAAAHAAGVIHRDFKPANVIVGKDGRVRVMDFGLARADGEHVDDDDHASPVTGHDLLSEDVTVTGTLMGTPLYMSPEAHRGHLPTEKSDQFSFCVALYSSLYQRAPFDTDESPDKSARWVIRDSRANVPGWIADAVRKGLAKDPEQRHPSMSALLAELERDPRRKRWAFAGLAGVIALAAAAWGAHEIRRHRALSACEAEAGAMGEVWNPARAASIGNAFAATGLSYATETWAHAQTQLDGYAKRWQHDRLDVCKRSAVDGALAPKLASAARSCLDEQRTGLDGLLDQLTTADNTIVERAAAASASLPQTSACTDEARLRHQPEPPTSPAVLTSIGVLRTQLAASNAAYSIGRASLALAYATAVVDGAKTLGWQPLVLDGQLAAGEANRALAHYDAALALFQDAFFVAGATGRDDVAETAAAKIAYMRGANQHQKSDAELWLRTADMLGDRLGTRDDVAAAALAATHGDVLVERGDNAQAQPFYERAIEIRRRILGDASPELAAALDALARTYSQAGNMKKSVELGEEALAIRERVLGPSHPAVATSLGNLSTSYGFIGDFDKAFELSQKALALREKLLPPDHLDIANNLNNLANSYGMRGDLKKSVELASRALDIYTKRLGPDAPQVGGTLRTLSHAYTDLHEYDKAIELGERALAIQEKTLGKDHPDFAMLCNQLSEAYGAAGKPERALALATRAFEILKARRGPDHYMTAITKISMANPENALHNYKAALAHATESLAVLEKTFGPDHPGLTEPLRALGDAKMGLGLPAEALPVYERELSLRLPVITPADEYAETQFRIARALWDSGGDHARALELAHKAEKALSDGKHEASHKAITDWLATHH